MNPQYQPGPTRPEDYNRPEQPAPHAPFPAQPARPVPAYSPYAQPAPVERPMDRSQPAFTTQRPEVETGDVLSPSGNELSWTASEFIAHSKEPSWYMALFGGAFVLSLLVYVATRDVVAAVVVIVGAILFGVSASRPPRQMTYTLSQKGLAIGSRIFLYKDFRSFSVVDEGAFSSIVLMPLKRFAPPLSLYYHPADAQRIVSVLAEHLPLQEHKHDLTETLMRRIRF